MFSKFIPAFAGFVFFALTISASAQSSGAAGTIDGLVTDPAGSVIPGAQVELNNQLTGYHRATRTDAAGAFHFLNIPLNSYKVTVSTTGFTVNTQDVTLRSSARVALKFALALADEHTTVTVEGGGIAMLENGDQEWPNAFWVVYDPAAAPKPPAVLAVDATLLAQKLRAVKQGTSLDRKSTR